MSWARQLATWAAAAAVLRLVVVPPESCPRAAPAAARDAIDEAAAWLVRGQETDGRFRYGYFRDRGEVAADYNSTRHAGVVDVLYRVGRVRAADSGLRYVLDRLVDHDGWTAFAPAGEDANVGANALVVAALVHRREGAGDRRYDGLARAIGRFLVAQQRADGSVLKYWRPSTRRPVPAVFGKFSTGETFWALALLARTFPDEGWDVPAHRVAAYLATRRDRAEGYALRQADHWAAYGLATLAPAGLTGVEAAYARRLAGYFGFLTRLESERSGSPLNPLTESGASLGTIGEGLAALRRASGSDPRLADLHDDLGERLACLAGILVERQASSGGRHVRGAWFADRYTQMDDQQHAIAALLGSLEVLR